MREEPPCRLVGGHSNIVTQYNLKTILSQTYTSSRYGQLTGPLVLQPHCAGSGHEPKVGGRYVVLCSVQTPHVPPDCDASMFSCPFFQCVHASLEARCHHVNQQGQ